MCIYVCAVHVHMYDMKRKGRSRKGKREKKLAIVKVHNILGQKHHYEIHYFEYSQIIFT